MVDEYMRKIIVNGEEYLWCVGKQNIVIRDSDNHRIHVPFTELMEMQWTDIEHDSWKGNFHITPSDVEKYIKNKYVLISQLEESLSSKQKVEGSSPSEDTMSL
jgi:hypothetical protein